MRFPKEQLKKLGILFLNFLLLYGLLRLIITLAERTGHIWIYYAGTILYGAAVIALFVAFFILNGLFDLSVIWKLSSAIQGQGGGQDQN